MAEDLEEDYDDDDDGGGHGGGGGAAKKKKMLILIVLPVLLLVGGLAGAYFAGLLDSVVGGKKQDAPAAEAEAPKPSSGAPTGPSQVQGTIFYDLPEMLVDINGQGRKRTFLKIRISLELANGADVPAVEAVMPRIIDNFQIYLRELRLEDLQGAAGIYRLREELLVRVNAAVRPAKVNDVLFKEMLIQ
ncbi:flagellar basal body-associated FliL family protein [Novispirillum itersonii]|uniref:flagellar basal body-associated FliL family protein n=1 Tax=Novispirillum itersonii TaxID=189 RepID=UPI00037AC4C9|nr:flagellar basal body-associated FliL family protein [Novispirillum itersonii]